jgi:hypothetical protein
MMIEIDTYFGRFFYCKTCKRWTWHDRIRKIEGEDVWSKKLFRCMICGTIVNWNGEVLSIMLK